MYTFMTTTAFCTDHTGASRDLGRSRCVSDVVVEKLTHLHHEDTEFLTDSRSQVVLSDSRQYSHFVAGLS